MSDKTATNMNVPVQISARLIRLDHSKGNYSAHDGSVRWFELVPVEIGNGSDPVFGLVSGGDTVAVCEPWIPAAMDDRGGSDNDPREPDRKAERQRTLDFLAATMQGDRVELGKLLQSTQREFGVGKSAARGRINKALKDRNGVAQVNGVSYLTRIEREEPSPPNPIFIVRSRVDIDDKHVENGEAASGTFANIFTAADPVPA